MSYNATTGKASCDRCGQWCMVGWNTDRMGGFTCGDCLERRTPLLQEIERQRQLLVEACAFIKAADKDGEFAEAFERRCMGRAQRNGGSNG